jgi:hypothetical protein
MELLKATETQAKPNEQQQTAEQGNEPTQQNQTEDLLTRVSKFVSDEDPSKKSEEQINQEVFNDPELRDKIESIEDPQLKEQMTQLRKSLMRGANDKFEEIATFRKELQLLKDGKPTEWSPQKIQSLLNDPKFVEAARQVAGAESSPEDPLAYADEGVKSYIKKLEGDINSLKTQNQQNWEQQNKVLREQQHRELGTKYANYDAKEIDTITFEMLEGKIQATPEHIYKAFKHDDNVRRAYELGRKDEREGVGERLESASFVKDTGTTQSAPAIKAEKGESSQALWDRIVEKNLKLAKTKS